MLDNLFSNKYFTIAILIALIVLAYMYNQKKSCEVEQMSGVDLTPLAQELSEHPWTDRHGGDNHKIVGNRFDKFADNYSKYKLRRAGFHVNDDQNHSGDKNWNLTEKYDIFDGMSKSNKKQYIQNYGQEHFDDYENLDDSQYNKKLHKRSDRSKRSNRYKQSLPRPLDNRPDLSQCQPCNCEADKLLLTSESSDSDCDPEMKYYKKMYKKRMYERDGKSKQRKISGSPH